MEKTIEQKLASKERFLAQEAKALDMLRTEKLYDYINGLRYAYSFSIRYKKNMRYIIEEAAYINPFKEVIKDQSAYAKTPLEKCLKAGILRPWNNTYWFDKEKAESLQQYILERN